MMPVGVLGQSRFPVRDDAARRRRAVGRPPISRQARTCRRRRQVEVREGGREQDARLVAPAGAHRLNVPPRRGPIEDVVGPRVWIISTTARAGGGPGEGPPGLGGEQEQGGGRRLRWAMSRLTPDQIASLPQMRSVCSRSSAMGRKPRAEKRQRGTSVGFAASPESRPRGGPADT